MVLSFVNVDRSLLCCWATVTRQPPFDGLTNRPARPDFFTPTIGPPRGDRMSRVWTTREVLSRVACAATHSARNRAARRKRGDTISYRDLSTNDSPGLWT